jgi:hypothetical protein
MTNKKFLHEGIKLCMILAVRPLEFSQDPIHCFGVTGDN